MQLNPLKSPGREFQKSIRLVYKLVNYGIHPPAHAAVQDHQSGVQRELYVIAASLAACTAGALIFTQVETELHGSGSLIV